MTSEESAASDRTCSFIAVIGAPNAGKSTLVNAFVGAKVSIVTHKVQTTRARVRGVAIDGAAQLVFIDTPGIFRPRRKLDRAMVAAAWEGLDGADETILLVDATAFDGEPKASAMKRAREDTIAIVKGLAERGAPALLVVNKVDQIDRPRLLAVASALNEEFSFEETFFISAARNDGVSELKAFLAARAPAGPWMYPEDQLSDISDRLLAAEITREKLYLRLHEELPYESTVETTDWRRTAKGELRIEQTIFVARDGQKPIVLGKAGQTIKAVSSAAREELCQLFGEPVHLFVFVKVRENWAEENARLREIGLDPTD
ncbi:MAG: GTPase Era [Alphaproteobacteria bacterium]|nr:GTPase Era [Alphaproteobacteria bacterium]